MPTLHHRDAGIPGQGGGARRRRRRTPEQPPSARVGAHACPARRGGQHESAAGPALRTALCTPQRTPPRRVGIGFRKTQPGPPHLVLLSGRLCERHELGRPDGIADALGRLDALLRLLLRLPRGLRRLLLRPRSRARSAHSGASAGARAGGAGLQRPGRRLCVCPRAASAVPP